MGGTFDRDLKQILERAGCTYVRPEAGIYMVGDVEQVTRQLRDFYAESGGFGTLLIVAGKAWATEAKRERSMRLFMSEVAPRLRDLDPAA